MGQQSSQNALQYVLDLVPPEVLQVIKDRTLQKLQSKCKERQYWKKGEFELLMAAFIFMLVYPVANVKDYFKSDHVSYHFLTSLFDLKSMQLFLSSLCILDRDPEQELLDTETCEEQYEEELEEEEEYENDGDSEILNAAQCRRIRNDQQIARIIETSELCQAWISRFTQSFIKYMGDVDELSLDECLLKCQTRCSNLMYLPNKLGKWGLLLRCVCDAQTGYLINMFLVLRGVKITNEQVCQRLLDPLPKKSYTVAMDSFYTCKSVIDYFVKNKMPLVGTIMLSRCKGVKFDKLEPAHYQQIPKGALNKNFYLTFYQVTKTKKVVLAHTFTTPDLRRKSTRKLTGSGKPQIAKRYNRIYGGVDHMDHYLSNIRPKLRTRRWPTKLFFHMLSIVLHNALCLYKRDHKNTKLSLSGFAKLVMDQIYEQHYVEKPKFPIRPGVKHEFVSVKECESLKHLTHPTCSCGNRTRNCCSCGEILCKCCFIQHFYETIIFSSKQK